MLPEKVLVYISHIRSSVVGEGLSKVTKIKILIYVTLHVFIHSGNNY